ncbi:MAG: hypothetical protein KF809_17270 [Chloroflexi bacterium]|nr:hypothetical protein [Chloroflexota bacterium]
MTQTQELLALLRERPEGVTPLEALDEIGTLRLAARVYDLRAEGHVIEDRTVPVTARNGRTAHVKRYRLVVA